MLNLRKNAKKLSLIFVTLVILISISTVSAATLSIDANSGETINVDGLQMASDGDTIELTGDFSGLDNVGINIDKNIIFTSDSVNPATIDGGGIDWLFFNPFGKDVTFENIKFTNAFESTVNGGVIESYGGTLTFNNCIFEGNSAVNGGAIYISGGTLELNDCTFDGNTATVNGGAIAAFDSDVSLTGCIFNLNLATEYGGAIYQIHGSLTLDNVDFGGDSIAYSGTTIDENDGSLATANEQLLYLLLENVVYDADDFVSDPANDVNDYDADKWQDVLDLIADAQNLISVGALDQNEIDTMVSDLNTALVDLIASFTGLDYSALTIAITAAGAYNNPSAYTAATWAAFQTALTNAINVRLAVSQAVIDASATQLNTAITGLVRVTRPSTSGGSTTPTTPTVSGYTGPVGVPNTQTQQTVQTKTDYTALSNAISSVANLKSKDYSPASWSALQKALTNAKNLNKAKNAVSQVDIDAIAKTLTIAKSKLAKRNVDLKITKVVKSGNRYKVTIKNSGKDKSTATKIRAACPCGKYVKTFNVKAIGASKSMTLTIKYSALAKSKHNQVFTVNYNKAAYEKNYKNNVCKIGKV